MKCGAEKPGVRIADPLVKASYKSNAEAVLTWKAVTHGF